MEETIRIQDREELIFLLSEASELEHVLCCAYLFAAFSMKRSVEEGITEEQLKAVTRWQRTIYGVAAQEMLHLSLASNLLTAIGAAPHFRRPNFPVSSGYYPAEFEIGLSPLSDRTLQHFIYIERPEGVELKDAPGLSSTGASADALVFSSDIVPMERGYRTVGHLYRGIEHGFQHLAEKLGEDRLFIGPKRAQATKRYFSFPELIPVTDLASAVQAIETIVEEGEGARGDIEDCHYGKFLSIREELHAMKKADPSFEPTRPVLADPFCRAAEDGSGGNLIDDPLAVQVGDLFNASYEVLLLMLARFFAHTGETDDELKLLIDVAITEMFEVIEPLGELLTGLPAGPSHPGMNAGPSFQFYRSVHVLPHKEAAWVIFWERMDEIATACRCIAEEPDAPVGLDSVHRSLGELAAMLKGGKE